MGSGTDRVGELFDYLADQPEGVTIDDIAAELGVVYSRARKIVRKLRLLLGETDQINLVCDPAGASERWIYRLVGNLEAARPWIDTRLRDLEARLETSRAVAKSLISATDGRTNDGKRVRKIERALTRLLEDLEELSEV